MDNTHVLLPGTLPLEESNMVQPTDSEAAKSVAHKGWFLKTHVRPPLNPRVDVKTKTLYVRDAEFTQHSLLELWYEIAQLKEKDFLNVKAPTIGKGTLRDILWAEGLRHPFNPVLDSWAEYKWDGVRRLEHVGYEYFGTDDTELQNVSVATLIEAMVARQVNPGCKFPYAPIMYSHRRGMGKSTSLEILAGGYDYFSDSWEPNLFADLDKSIIEELRNVTIAEIPEVDTMPQSAVLKMDKIITTREFRARKSYDREITKIPISLVFVKTTNNSAVIQRDDVNRRDIVIEVKRDIDLEKLERDRSQLIMEAKARYKGVDVSLPPRLWKAAEEFAERFRNHSELQVWLEYWTKGKDEFSTRDLNEQQKEARIFTKRNRDRMLTSLGYRQVNRDGVRGYVKFE